MPLTFHQASSRRSGCVARRRIHWATSEGCAAHMTAPDVERTRESEGYFFFGAGLFVAGAEAFFVIGGGMSPLMSSSGSSAT